jgi:hypothetical protein
VHVSATSQTPPASRQVTPADTNVHVAEQHEPAAPFAPPASHCSPPSVLPLPQVGVTVMVTVAATDVLLPSLTVYVNESLPEKPGFGV